MSDLLRALFDLENKSKFKLTYFIISLVFPSLIILIFKMPIFFLKLDFIKLVILTITLNLSIIISITVIISILYFLLMRIIIAVFQFNNNQAKLELNKLKALLEDGDNENISEEISEKATIIRNKGKRIEILERIIHGFNLASIALATAFSNIIVSVIMINDVNYSFEVLEELLEFFYINNRYFILSLGLSIVLVLIKIIHISKSKNLNK